MTMESRKKKVLGIAKQAGFVVDIGGHDDRNALLIIPLVGIAVGVIDKLLK